MKLQKMTDFVLEQSKKSYNSNRYYESDEPFNACERYAHFLQQSLTLGMLVPCDEDGNVLDQPCDIMNTEGCRHCACKEYKKAKEKVLFKGFTKKKNATILDYKWGQIQYLLFRTGNIHFYGIDHSEEDRPSHNLKTIEDLVKMYEIELTESALKQIEINDTSHTSK